MASKDIYRPELQYNWYPDPNHEGMERCMLSVPGYVDPGPRDGSWCGKHGMELSWIIRGPKGAVEFSINTGWVPGEVGLHARWGGQRVDSTFFPYSNRMTTHASGMPVDFYTENYEPTRTDCMLFGSEPQPCWVNSVGFPDEALLVEYAREGDKAIWKALHDEYADIELTDVTKDNWVEEERKRLHEQANNYTGK